MSKRQQCWHWCWTGRHGSYLKHSQGRILSYPQLPSWAGNPIKSSILLWTDTHQLLVPQITNKFSSCSNELAPEVNPVTNKKISPFQEQPAQLPIVRTHFTEAAWSSMTTQPTPAVLTAAQLLPRWILLPLLSHFHNYSLNANRCIAGCVSATPHFYCNHLFNHKKWRFRKS